jgi:hypothetical protein
MKRSKRIQLTFEERRTMGLVFASLAVACGFIVWIHLSWHGLIPPSEVNVRIDPDGRVRTQLIGKSEARIVRVEGSRGEPIRLYVDRSDDGNPRVTLAACRGCNAAAKPSHVRRGRLVCGYCGQPMPLLPPGAPLPAEADCTPIPVLHYMEGNFVVVGQTDAAASQTILMRGKP